MALQLKDRVRTACTTVGTGNIIVGSNRAGYQNWDAITNGNTVYYCIVEGNEWEVGHGVKTDGEITRTLIASSTGSLIDLKGTEDVFETYPADKAVILDVDGNLTVDGDVFADNLYTKTATDTLLDSKANVGDSYTKAETYSNVEIDGELFKKADKTDTYTKAEVDATQDAQNTNINSNTTAIGTLSGKVATNTADIATLQDGIFFSSSYTTDYPASVNRDPGTGNIYLQNLSAFTYSYADANQAFISKTDEQGNVRQFTAVKPDDIIVLNQVESANYGRYKVSSVNDLGDYVNVIMDFQVGEGTVLEGDTLALQAFPASAGGCGGEGTVADGCIYLNNQTIISDYTIPTGKNGMSAGAIKFDGTVTVPTGSAYHVVDSNEDSIWTEPTAYAVQYESPQDNQTTVLAKSGDKKAQIVQYTTGQSYFKGDGATYFGNNSDNEIYLQRNNVTKVTIEDGGVSFNDPVTFNQGTTQLCSQVYPNNISNLSSQSWGALTNNSLTVDVTEGKRYIITGGTNMNISNITGANTYAYYKVAIAENGGTAVDTRLVMTGGAKTTSGGVGWLGALERSYMYTPTFTGSITLSAYGKVAGSGATASLANNSIRIQEV